MIPLVMLEEHHEAYLAWHVAVREEWMPATGNVLLHVDEHADTATPRLLARPLDAPLDDLRDAARVTYDDLDIGNFIWPAVYRGLFSRICWLRREHVRTHETARQSMYVATADDSRRVLIAGLDLPVNRRLGHGDRRTIVFERVCPFDEFSADGAIALDIDLDYFASERHPTSRSHRLEVTAEAFAEFGRDAYHFLRVLPSGPIAARQEGPRYFLYFNWPAEDRRPPPLGDELIARLDRFDRVLGEWAVNPTVITVSRSRRSGYTPEEVANFVESELLSRLAARYAIGVRRVAEFRPSPS